MRLAGKVVLTLMDRFLPGHGRTALPIAQADGHIGAMALAGGNAARSPARKDGPCTAVLTAADTRPPRRPGPIRHVETIEPPMKKIHWQHESETVSVGFRYPTGA
jgi:hypothetical protein